MGQKTNILIVDDQVEIAEYLAEELSEHGLEAKAIDTISEAVDLCSENEYQVVISDFHMPEGNAVDLFSALKSVTDMEKLCFFILSGDPFLGEKENEDLAFAHVITKPFSIEDMISLIREKTWKHSKAS